MASGSENGVSYQSFQIDGNWFIRRHSPAPAAYNACACSVAYSCPDTAWSGGQFVCKYGKNCIEGTVVWSIPGLVKGCTLIETVFSSDLRCFFNQTCLNIILAMFNVDMPQRNPLPTDTIGLKALNSSILSPFLPNATLRLIFRELMIVNWKFATDYTGYYTTCAPDMCVYTLTERLDIIYGITTMVGLFGGLVVSFKLFISIGVRLFLWAHTMRTERSATEHPGKISR